MQILTCDKAKGWGNVSLYINSKKQYLKTQFKRQDTVVLGTVQTLRHLAGWTAAIPYQPAKNLDYNIQEKEAEESNVLWIGYIPCVQEE